MTNSQAIILGVVQGLTEYLPVSSSAHLVLVPKIMGWKILPKESFIFDVLVQLGTLFGVVLYFFTPLKEVVISVARGLVMKKPFHDENARMGWLVTLASIPAAFLGLFFKDELAYYFSSPIAACFCLIITGCFLFVAEYLTRVMKDLPTKSDAMIIGFAQGAALFPGISRSGATIAAGMACGLSRRKAAQFSFLMSIPVMLGASAIAFLDLIKDVELLASMSFSLVLGFTTAALSGYVVIAWFMNFLSNKKLTLFALYCLLVGSIGVVFLSQ